MVKSLNRQIRRITRKLLSVFLRVWRIDDLRRSAVRVWIQIQGWKHRFCSCDRVIPLVILIMNAAKVAISIDQRMLRHLDRLVKSRVFRSRSEAIQKAVEEKLVRLEKS